MDQYTSLKGLHVRAEYISLFDSYPGLFMSIVAKQNERPANIPLKIWTDCLNVADTCKATTWPTRSQNLDMLANAAQTLVSRSIFRGAPF